MTNWCKAKGKKYKDYKHALKNWVLKYAEERIEKQNEKSKITFINPE